MNALNAACEARDERRGGRPLRDTPPAHWDRRRLKFVSSRPIVNGLGEAGAYDEPGWPRYVRITDIAGPRTLRSDSFKSLPPLIADHAPVAVGDLLLAAVGATYGKSYLHTRDDGPACFAGYLVRVTPGPKMSPAYVAYWTESSDYWNQVHAEVVQSTIQNFSATKYRELVVPLPPLGDQNAIAAFLDCETEKIDALVTTKRRLIELLEEKRTALISQAVTKGLDSDAPMKDSGIQWLGDIPRHWELLPLKRIAETRYGLGQPPAEHAEGIPIIRATDISRGTIAEEGMLRVDPEDVPKTRDAFLAPGEIIVVRSGAYTGDSAIVPQHLAGCVAGYDMVVRVRRGDPSFISWQLLADVVRVAHWEPLMLRAAQPHLNVEELANTLVCRPPEREQRRIAQHLADETARLDELGSKERQLMKLLREYRSALITAAVTGQIDVRTYHREVS